MRSYTTIWGKRSAVAHMRPKGMGRCNIGKVAMNMTILQKYRVFCDGGKEQELCPFQEIEEQVEKEAVLQEESVCEATDRNRLKPAGYDAELRKIASEPEIPKVSRNTADGGGRALHQD